MAWDVPVYRIHAYVQSLNRQRAARRKKARAEFHLKRARAELQLLHGTQGLRTAKDVLHANIMLNDIRPRGLQVFSHQSIPFGQKVSISIPAHRGFFAHGRVIGCEPLSPRITPASGVTPKYRVVIAFDFESIDERLAIKNFCDDLQKNYLTSPDL